LTYSYVAVLRLEPIHPKVIIMINYEEIDTEILESMTIYLSDTFREDKTESTTYASPFAWMKRDYTVVGVRTQVAKLKNSKLKEDAYRSELLNLLRRTCSWKNGKSQDKRIKETLEIFTYLDIEKEFEESLT